MVDPQDPGDGGDTPGLADWRRLVRDARGSADGEDWGSHTPDGILVEPLYFGRTDVAPLPGRLAPRWIILQAIDAADPDQANTEVLEAIAGGATGVSLRFSDATGLSGLPLARSSLEYALEGVDLAAIHLRLEPHPRGVELARWLRELLAEQGGAPERANVCFGLDPIGVRVLLPGAASDDLGTFASLSELHEAGFRGELALLDSRVWHDAGASEAQELAALLAAAAWWLRGLDRDGFDAVTGLPLFSAAMSVDMDQFMSIAKLRALRLLWGRFAELCGCAGLHLPIHAETSRRMMTRADPHTNILRTTLAAFAAAAGCADSITVLSHTAALGRADRHARALARNVQLLLMEEADLHLVRDPAAGSGAVEALTDALGESAWAEFQSIERDGGIVECLRKGLFQARILQRRAALADAVASGTAPLVGATIYRSGPATEGGPLAEPPPHSGFHPVRLEEFWPGAA